MHTSLSSSLFGEGRRMDGGWAGLGVLVGLAAG